MYCKRNNDIVETPMSDIAVTALLAQLSMYSRNASSFIVRANKFYLRNQSHVDPANSNAPYLSIVATAMLLTRITGMVHERVRIVMASNKLI